MAVYTLPNKRLFFPRRMEVRMAGNVDVNRSPMNGVVTTVEMPGDAWAIRIEYGNNYTIAERDEQRAFWDRFRGQAHLLRIWPIFRAEPRGTAQPTSLASLAVEGANVIVLTVASGATLLPGDFLMVNQTGGYTQLVEVAEATTGTTTCTAELVAPLRRAAAAGSAITWQRPTADFLLTEAPFIPHEPRVSSGFSIEAVEFVT